MSLTSRDGAHRLSNQETANALDQILRDAQPRGVLDLVTRQAESSVHSMSASSSTPYGHTTQTMDCPLKSGGDKPVLLVHPFAWYSDVFFRSVRCVAVAADQAATMMSPARWKSPGLRCCTPMRDTFAPDLTRRYQCLYFSWLVLGMAAFAREDAWTCKLIVTMSKRSKVVRAKW